MEIPFNVLFHLRKILQCKQAAQADKEIAAGKYRGPLHGIPYGLKDLFAVNGTKTTWGAEPYKDQVIDNDSYVYTKLKEAGAVLIAKLTLGALPWMIIGLVAAQKIHGICWKDPAVLLQVQQRQQLQGLFHLLLEQKLMGLLFLLLRFAEQQVYGQHLAL